MPRACQALPLPLLWLAQQKGKEGSSAGPVSAGSSGSLPPPLDCAPSMSWRQRGNVGPAGGNSQQFPVMQPLFAATPCPEDCHALRVYMGRPHTRLEGAFALHWIPPCWRLTTETHIRGPCS